MPQVTMEDASAILTEITDAGIPVWLDGGWCVDALVGRQLREHDDLDLAVPHSAEPRLRAWLTDNGYSAVETAGETPWNFVVRDRAGRRLDIHVFDHDEHGESSYGVAYPLASLAGTALLGGVRVNCISPEWMFTFKTSYVPREKDVLDVRALADRYGFDIPTTHQADAAVVADGQQV